MENKVYNYYGFHCLELIETSCAILDGYSGFLMGNVIKYVYRAGIKTIDYKQDLLKALDYLREFMTLNCNIKIESIQDNPIEYYDYILKFKCMEHYKFKFFSELLYYLVTRRYKNLIKCVNILNNQIY